MAGDVGDYDYYQGRPELAEANRIVEEKIKKGELSAPRTIGEAYDQLDNALKEVRASK